MARFNWDSWDRFDENAVPDVCTTTVSGGTSGTSGVITPPISSSLTLCQSSFPPRIDEFNIIPSTQIEVRIYGDYLQ